MGWEVNSIGRLILWAYAVLGSAAFPAISDTTFPTKHLATVQDSIAMTRLADPVYFAGGSSEGRVAHFSQDGKRFVVVLEQGNLARGTTDFFMYLFDSADLPAAKPQLLVAMGSSSNRSAISQVTWLADNKTIVFLGENPGEQGRVYSLNVGTHALRVLASADTAIVDYGITPDGQTIVFVAEPLPVGPDAPDEVADQEIVVTGQSLADLLAGNCRKAPWWRHRLFVQSGNSARSVPLDDAIYGLLAPVSVSPGGHYAVVPAFVREFPSVWEQYTERSLHDAVQARPREGRASLTLQRYLLVDVAAATAAPLLNSPVGESPSEIVWNSSGSSVFLESFLPLDIPNGQEKELRKRRSFPVEIRVSDRAIRKLSAEDWQQIRNSREDSTKRWEVMLREDSNDPPRIYVRRKETRQETLLLDLNPQFADIEFARVEELTWKATDGHEVSGGLYLPPFYNRGKRYPLVIQTHGFNPHKFWMDGPWASAYAAQALAARGIVVLQVGGATNHEEARKYSGTVEEGPRAMAELEGAIEFLDEQKVIDPSRVGVVGFSRTVYAVDYTLTHSKHRFLAAVLVDGIDAGYFNHVVFGPYGDNELNGAPPVGDGLALWLKNSPAFNIDKIDSAIRLVALGREDAIGFWEWFSLLTEMDKPVDFVVLPGAEHLIVRPSDKLAAQGGMVDWFSFWLNGEEDPALAKKKQYTRWRMLRDIRRRELPSLRKSENGSSPDP